jgi:DNA helicase HerA-like ATPase
VTAVSLSIADIATHLYVLGATRSGKTNLLLRLISLLSDKERQSVFPCSIILIDPHGDAALSLAEIIQDWQNLLIFDPEYTSFSFNPLELYPKPMSNSERAILIQNQVSELVTILVDVLNTDPSQTPRMQWIYRGALYYLYSFCDNPTFLDLYYLMSDMVRLPKEDMAAMFRRADVAEEVTNRTIEAISTLERNAFTGVLNRIFNFVMPSESITTRTFCSRRSTLPFSKMLEPGFITIFRLSRANLPNDFREVITNTLVLKIYFLVQQRAREIEEKGLSPSSRKQVFLFIDEFQVVQRLTAIERMLSEGAKFGLSLVIAHQNMSQIRQELQESILSNARTVCCFRTGPSDASKLAKLFGERIGINADTRDILVKLPKYTMVVRRSYSGMLARPEIWKVSKVREALHSQSEVIAFMKGEMEKLYGGARAETEPVYQKEMENILKERGQPLMSPLNWRLLTHLYYSQGKGFERSTFSYISRDFARDYGWGLSLIQNALDRLMGLGYVSRREITGMIYTGKDQYNNPVWRLPNPSNRDELERARTYEYEITEAARRKFFSRPEAKSQRAGGPLHRRVMDMLIDEYRQKGCWVDADYGERHEQMPDIMVIWPKLRSIDSNGDDRRGAGGLVKESWSPHEWDSRRAWAIEIETSPGKNQRQVRRNYEKCVKKSFEKIIFVITTEEHREAVQRALCDVDPSSYNVQLVDVGMSIEDLRRMLKKEEEQNATPEEDAQEPGAVKNQTVNQEHKASQPAMVMGESINPQEAISPSEVTEPFSGVALDNLIERKDKDTGFSPDSASGVDQVKLYEILCALDPNMPQGRAEIMKRYHGISERQLSRYLAALVNEGLAIVDRKKYILTEKGKKVAEVIRSS